MTKSTKSKLVNKIGQGKCIWNAPSEVGSRVETLGPNFQSQNSWPWKQWLKKNNSFYTNNLMYCIHAYMELTSSHHYISLYRHQSLFWSFWGHQWKSRLHQLCHLPYHHLSIAICMSIITSASHLPHNYQVRGHDFHLISKFTVVCFHRHMFAF